MHRVIRVPGLTGGTLPKSESRVTALASHVFEILRMVFRDNEHLIGTDLTVLDGTTWYDGVAVNVPVLDVDFVNVLWNGYTAHVVVAMTNLKTIKHEMFYRRRIGETAYVTFHFDIREPTPSIYIISYGAGITLPTNYFAKGGVGVDAMNRIDSPLLEYPVAAATLLGGTVWYVERPYRHDHIVFAEEFLKEKDRLNIGVGTQGFLTNHGNFIGRKRAMVMAVENRMIIDMHPVEIGVSYTYDPKRYSGLIQNSDRLLGDGFRIANVSLFSEDMW